MRYQASAIRAKPVRPGLRSPPPSFSPDAFPFSSQILSSLVPGIAQFVSGTPAQPAPSNPLTSSPNVFISWTPSAIASSSPSLAAYFTFSTSERWTLPNKHARALSNSSPVPSPACPTAKVSSPPSGPSIGSFRTSRSHQLTLFLPGYATASVEGRIAVEYFDPSPAIQEKKYAFKCHRQTIDDVDHVWPVNALAFHPTYNTFASGGSDATVSIWDHKVKKRLRQYTKYNAPVAALAFSADGSRLAIGASYTWDAGEEGARTAERPSLFVRELGEEVKVCLLLGRPAAVCVRRLNFLCFLCSQKDGVLTEGVVCRAVSDSMITVQS